MITIGEIARTFGQLPSKVRDEGTTFDIMVHDVLMAWDQYQNDRANGKMITPDVDEKTLLEIMQKAKG